MINLEYVKDGFPIHSMSGRIEFMIFYNRIKYLVNFYNYTLESYFNYINEKYRERKRIEDNIDEILRLAEEHDIDFTEEEAFITIDEEILGTEMNFIEYQKMTFLIFLFSEVEKLTDNLYDLDQNFEIVKRIDKKIQNLCLAKMINDEDVEQIIDVVNELRLIRNKLVHSYDYFDNEITVNGSTYKGIKQLSDKYLEYLVNRIIESFLKLEEGYGAIS